MTLVKNHGVLFEYPDGVGFGDQAVLSPLARTIAFDPELADFFVNALEGNRRAVIPLERGSASIPEIEEKLAEVKGAGRKLPELLTDQLGLKFLNRKAERGI